METQFEAKATVFLDKYCNEFLSLWVIYMVIIEKVPRTFSNGRKCTVFEIEL